MDQLGSFCCNATKNNVLTNTTQSPLILSPPASEEWNVFLSMMGKSFRAFIVMPEDLYTEQLSGFQCGRGKLHLSQWMQEQNLNRTYNDSTNSWCCYIQDHNHGNPM
ncbi:PLAC8-like protein 1 isoform X3 [Hemicordylus capensis]|uniref:PLAC8-like protein 1 isoform X3 n=1 Tax=Hemicordylus capensis TaxID=884348 RepID=UPI00230393C8|nr:PLAC8-like protein 1 isoform X3 [Hemicordylus capensis]